MVHNYYLTIRVAKHFTPERKRKSKLNVPYANVLEVNGERGPNLACEVLIEKRLNRHEFIQNCILR